MKTIPLTKGFVALVDDEDFESLASFKWHVSKQPNGRNYAARSVTINGKCTSMKMHRQIMSPEASRDVDHENYDGLDNRRENLRIATRSQNKASGRLSTRNKTGLRGIKYDKRRGSWRAELRKSGRSYSGGSYCFSPEDAARLYDRLAAEHFGEFARLNFPEVCHR